MLMDDTKASVGSETVRTVPSTPLVCGLGVKVTSPLTSLVIAACGDIGEI